MFVIKLHPQYITDSKGKRIPVVLPIKKYEALFEELEDLRDVKLYDQAKSGKQNTLQLRMLWSTLAKSLK